MNDSSSQEVAIFTHAVELPEDERAAYLAEACGNDEALRLRVEALLHAHSQASGFMEQTPTALDHGDESFTRESAGDRIDRYKLLQRIGEGGCGVVFMAEQEEPVRRLVALKVIKPGMDTKSVIARFESERQALAMMEHPNIAQVFDAGSTESGRPYFVMELVRGVKITDYCDRLSLSTAERLDLLIQLCHAVQHAHQKGIIHRDIKPTNILVTTTEDGKALPKVIDFGIAKATTGQRLTDKTLFTAFEMLIGTPAYMSPEQAAMTNTDVDTRTDIYSLGVLLYELLTGKTPFDANELLSVGLDEMRRTIREVEPARPSTRLSTMVKDELTTTARRHHTEAPKLIHLVRGDLDWIVMKCLEKDRRRRYETANGLAMDVQRHLNNEPVIARPPSAIYRFQKLVRRNKLTFVASVSIGLIVLFALVILSFSNLRITRERNQKEAALEAARTSEQKARDELFHALRSEAEARRLSRQMGQRLESLEAVAGAARIRSDERLRDDAIAAMALPDVRLGPAWKSERAGIEIPIAFDSLYERYALRESNGAVAIRTIPSGEKIQELTSGVITSSYAAMLSFSDDGKFLAEFVPGAVKARAIGARADEGEVLTEIAPTVWRLADGHSVLKNAPETWIGAFSPDSREIALATSDFVARFDLMTGQEINRWPTRGVIRQLIYHPNNRRIAVTYSDSKVLSVYDAATGATLTELPVGIVGVEIAAWHPDGQRLAVAGPKARIRIWDTETARQVATMEGHVQPITHLSFHPDGQLLASSSWDGTSRLWDASSGRQLLQLSHDVGARIGSDGRWLGFTPNSPEEIQLLEIAPSREYRTLASSSAESAGYSMDGDVSPDGRLLVMGMDGGVCLWELASGRQLAFLPHAAKDEVRCALFTLDGTELFTCARRTGVQRWKIERDAANADELRVNLLRQLPLPFAPERIALSQDGKSLAVVSESAGQARILDTGAETSLAPTMDHPAAGFVALSRDGRSMATSGWNSDRVRLWDARTGKMLYEWSVPEKSTIVSITPDNHPRLVICRRTAFEFWDVETLALESTLRRDVSQFPGFVAFTSDGKLMALEMAPGVVHLKDVSTGRTVAKLEDPFGDRGTWLAFTPDTTELVVASRLSRAVHCWDLRAIRKRLKEMQLDWDWPEFAPVKASTLSH
jgi:serine/threonine protein kinase/WD40 repeat protein